MFVPFAHLFAAVLTAALTGSMYYVISSPKGNVVECNQSLLSKLCQIIYIYIYMYVYVWIPDILSC
jgi:hypothetical protein